MWEIIESFMDHIPITPAACCPWFISGYHHMVENYVKWYIDLYIKDQHHWYYTGYRHTASSIFTGTRKLSWWKLCCHWGLSLWQPMKPLVMTKLALGHPLLLILSVLQHEPTIVFSCLTLWPNNAIQRHKSESTLPQTMRFCLTEPSH